MFSIRQEVAYMNSGAWAERNPHTCACNGTGWALSNLDSWHKCPIHGFEGMMHPEHESEAQEYMSPDEWKAHCKEQEDAQTARMRELWVEIRAEFCNDLYTPHGGFLALVKELQGDDTRTPADWVAAADNTLNMMKGYYMEMAGELRRTVAEPREAIH